MHATPSHLRPMSLSDLLDGIFWVYRKGFFTFLGAVALISLPFAVVQAIFNFLFYETLPTGSAGLGATINEAAMLFPLLLILLVGLLQGFIAQPIMFGAVVWTTAQHMQGNPISIRTAYDYGSSRMFSMIGVTLLMTLLVFAVLVVPMLLVGCGIFLLGSSFASAMESSGDSSVWAVLLIVLVVGVLFLLIMAVWVFLGMRFLFTAQAVVLEGTGPIGAFKRSWGLTRDSFWRVFGITLLVGLLITLVSVVVSVGLSGAMAMASFASREGTMAYSGIQSLSVLLNSAVSILIFPFYGIFFTLFYYDLRVRKEGYDLEMMLGKSSAQ